jgi:hypothetical protein
MKAETATRKRQQRSMKGRIGFGKAGWQEGRRAAGKTGRKEGRREGSLKWTNKE